MNETASQSLVRRRYPPFARELWGLLGVAAAITAALLVSPLSWLAALPGAALFALVAFEARDPHRDPEPLPLAIVAPCDGTILDISDIDDPYLNRLAKRIRLRQPRFAVHSLFAPVEGKIIEQWRHFKPGGYASITWWIRSDEGDDVVIEITVPKIPFALQLNYQPGERVGHGRRFGFSFFGASVLVLVPGNSLVEVEPGSSSVAARQVLAKLVHDQPVSAIDAAGK
ncbi:MAG: hypothetical protein AAF384_03340 [Pseudomonadota bacterium]